MANQIMQDISAIADRAKTMFDGFEIYRDKIDWFMDIDTAHTNCPLDLQGLLDAEDGDFAHDMAGITQHLNRRTGQLEDCFVPRYAARQ